MIRVKDVAVPTSHRTVSARPIVQVRSLEKRFLVRRGWFRTLRHPLTREWARALKGIDLDVREGECFGVLGPNGAGKTTLFKILATLILPDDGTATVGGCDVVADPAGARRLLSPAISDERSLNWRLSAAENLRLYAAIHQIPRGERDDRIRELLEVVGLTEAGPKMVARYSTGMKQRLLIARALLPRPRVLLLDEPTRSLDPVSKRKFWAFVRQELVGARGCTVVLATHDPEETEALCDRIAILNRGVVLSIGPPRALLAAASTDRYHLWTSAPDQAVSVLPGARVASATSDPIAAIDGWTPIELEIAGGPEQAAKVNTFLVLQGIPVAHFERLRKSLSEYIEEVVEREDGRP
jgi:ABC-2 type transport system ATP-binding protein